MPATVTPDTIARMEIGKRILAALEETGLKQEAVARAAGIRSATLSDIINGKTKSPGYDTVRAIIEALGMTEMEFYSLGEESPSFDRSTGEFTKEELAEYRGKIAARGLTGDLSDEELARIIRIALKVVEGERKRDESD